MCTLDFYATAAAAAGEKLPERCDGVDLMPYLQGKKEGDAHEEIYWHNADPSDASHRNLRAMRWKDWRLILNKKPKKWSLYDLRKDPAEMNDLASENADIVASMSKRLDEWVKTLPPPIKSGPIGPGCYPPGGWGWIVGDGSGSGTGGTPGRGQKDAKKGKKGKKK